MLVSPPSSPAYDPPQLLSAPPIFGRENEQTLMFTYSQDVNPSVLGSRSRSLRKSEPRTPPPPTIGGGFLSPGVWSEGYASQSRLNRVDEREEGLEEEKEKEAQRRQTARSDGKDTVDAWPRLKDEIDDLAWKSASAHGIWDMDVRVTGCQPWKAEFLQETREQINLFSQPACFATCSQENEYTNNSLNYEEPGNAEYHQVGYEEIATRGDKSKENVHVNQVCMEERNNRVNQ
ncbi:unnamed protein product [Protopolystoma xenopodis]|uniref:Uncharacterized protein n=1 Tax=Protopolystoma xenopodis TaxID=117903 RepID=A0A448WWM5_9PLAT|nr:unnamed protein product [Protopolystoma xenopodis]